MSAVAQQMHASLSSVWRWRQTYQRDGLRGLRPTPTPGRPPRLSQGQLRTLEKILARGPRRAGYPTGLWTLARVAQVIQRQFGIRYHPSHVWKLLTARGWQCQPPELSEAEKQTLLRMLVGRGPRQAGPTLDRWTFGRVVELFRQEFGSQLHPSRIRQALTAEGWRCPRPERRAGQRDKAINAWGGGKNGPGLNPATPRGACLVLAEWGGARAPLRRRTARVARSMLANPRPDRSHPKHPKHDRWARRWERVGSETFPEERRPRGVGRTDRPPGTRTRRAPTRPRFPESLSGSCGTYR